MTENTLQVSGALLHYYEIGEGDRMITLINGYSRPGSDFRMFARRLSAHGIRCLFFDNRGAGSTTVDGDFTLSDMVGDVRALWHHLGITSSNVLGISMGGMIAQQLAIGASDVQKLILVSTSPHAGINVGEEIPWSNDPEKVMQKMRPYFSAAFRSKNKLLVESMVKQIAKQVETTDFVERTHLQRQALAGFDVTEQLDRISCPTLVLHGSEDGIVPLHLGQQLADRIPHAKLHVFPECGHLLLAEEPQEFAKLVADFLQ